MKDIIEKFYETYIEAETFLTGGIDKEKTNEEWKAYEILYESLTAEQEKKLLKYIRLRGDRQAQEMKKVFTEGFKTAIRLWTESLKQ